MAIKTLTLAAAISSSLVTGEMTQSQRSKKLSSYFSPSPGEVVRVDPDHVTNQNIKDKTQLSGYIKVNPPKGSCFTITRHHSYPDDRICKSTILPFKLLELDKGGRVSWIIKTGVEDMGHTYFWPTPHRIAHVIPAGVRPKMRHDFPVAINKCVTHQSKKKRNITLELMNGKVWIIKFPEKDELYPQPDSLPNLFILARKKSAGISAGTTLASAKKRKKNVYRGYADEPVTKYWAITIRGSFHMRASNFIDADSAPKMKGLCLYQLNNAPNDPHSGWIECHGTADHEVIFTHLSCSASLLKH